MLLSVERIKQSLLHPALLVRETAADYFGEAHSSVPEVIPLVIQAFRRYGTKSSVSGSRFVLTSGYYGV